MNAGLIKMLSVTVIVFLLTWPYVAGNTLTSLKGSELSSICGEGRVVVLAYTHLNESAEIYCLYRNASYNMRMRVSKPADVWKVDSQQNVGRGWYWPFWL